MCTPFCEGSLKRRHEAHLPETVGGPEHPHGRTGAPFWAAWLCVALSGTSLAQDLPSPGVVPADRRLEEGWRRIDLGDFVGARLIAAEAERVDPEAAPDAHYLTGVAWELERDHGRAIATFRDVVTQFPGHARARDAQFRLAVTWADRGRPDRALEELRAVGSRHAIRAEDTSGNDLLKIELCRATWIYASGHEVRGERLIARALAKAEPTQLTWFTAGAHAAILTHELEISEGIEFAVSDHLIPEQVADRGAHVERARAELDAIIALNEPWYVLEALDHFGASYVDLADDLLDAPRATGLDEVSEAILNATIESRATDQLVKAQQYYQLGVDLALRIHWIGPETAKLQEAAEAVGARVEALDADAAEPPG